MYQQKKHLNAGHAAFINHFRNVYSVVTSSVISDMHFVWVTGIHKISVNNYVNEISFSISQCLSYFVWCILSLSLMPFSIWDTSNHMTLIINEKFSGAEEKKMKGGKMQKRKYEREKKIDCQEILTFRITLHVKKNLQIICSNSSDY